MPERVLNQVKYLCRQIAKVEWSGVLFYSVEGSIKEPGKMVLTIEDILPMHKGTSAYTEYTFDERVVDYMMDNEVMEKGWKMGHVHSHNTMGVFFSGTDWSELEDNAPNHNFYLSLIVNNFMDFCAKVCFIVDCDESKEFSFSGKDENGQRYVYTTESYGVPDKKLVVYDCAIESPKNEIVVDDSFASKVDHIIAEAERVTARTTLTTGTTSLKNFLDKEKGENSSVGKSGTHQRNGTNTGGKKGKGWSRWQDQMDAWSDKSWHQKIDDEPKEEIKASKNFKNGGPNNEDVLLMHVSDRAYIDAIEAFSMYVVNGGNSTEEYGDIDDITEMYMQHKVSGKALASHILENYSDMYDAFFEKLEDRDDAKLFIDITKDLIDNLESECEVTLLPQQVELIRPVIFALENMIRTFEAAAEGKNKMII